MSKERTIFVTERDLERLTSVLRAHGAGRDMEACAALEDELGRARVVESAAIPHDVVTMNSRVRFQDVETGDETEVTLVYPKDADIGAGKVSVLAPVGSALLGLSCGESIEWPMPAGRKRHLRIVAVTYQPEAAGDLQL
jgi:regulator of nucleoside diphosphate kinase